MPEILDTIYRLITREQTTGYKDSSSLGGLEGVVGLLCDKELATIKDEQIQKMLQDMKLAVHDYGESKNDMRERKIAELGRILLSLRDAYQQLKKLSASSQERRTSYPNIKDKALNYKQEGRYAEAISEFEKVLESQPNDDFALSHLAHIYLQQGRLEESSRLIDMALKVNPSNPFANTVKGEILFTEGNMVESAMIFEGLINLKPDDVYAYNKLGIIYRKQGKINEAMSILKRGLEISTDNPSLHHALGDVYSQLGNDEEAIAEYQKAIDIDPEDEYAFRGLVSRKSRDKDAKMAISQLQKVLKIPSHSQNPHLHALLASYLRREKQYEAAVTELREALRINPGSIYFQTQLAFCYSKLEQYDKVIELLEPINRIRPQDSLIVRAMAKAYAHTNRGCEKAVD
jgi:tetratricopeptide (TPR) repeat protein